MRATWYELEDGTLVDPSECVSDAKGTLTHKSGVRVAMKLPGCPKSRGVDIGDDGRPAGSTVRPAAARARSRRGNRKD